jgi:hypothetical protein
MPASASRAECQVWRAGGVNDQDLELELDFEIARCARLGSCGPWRSSWLIRPFGLAVPRRRPDIAAYATKLSAVKRAEVAALHVETSARSP